MNIFHPIRVSISFGNITHCSLHSVPALRQLPHLRAASDPRNENYGLITQALFLIHCFSLLKELDDVQCIQPTKKSYTRALSCIFT